MGNYSIRELELLTGVKAHTIRIWEQRYHILEPQRTDTNIRTYTEDDLKYLLNVALLNKNGFKISHISKMTVNDVRKKVLELSENNFTYSNQVDALTVAMIDFDEDGFEKLLATNILRIGFEDTFLNIVFTFLRKVGILWQTGIIRPAHEHFISNLIRQKIIVATDGQHYRQTEKTRRFMLFLPEKEMHELTLLFVNYVLRARKHHTLYLGSNVPFEDIELAFKDYNPHFLLSSFTSNPAEAQLQQYINQLYKSFPNSSFILSGRQLLENNVELKDNMHLMQDLAETIGFIENLQ